LRPPALTTIYAAFDNK